MGEEKKENVQEKQEKALMAEACAAYGIAPEYVFSSRVAADGEVVILTNGGTRVRYRKGDKVEPLGQIAITGVNPAKRKPITGGKK